MVARAKNKMWQGLQKDSIPLEKLAQHFEAYNLSEGLSPRTVECYSRVLNYFGDYLEKHNLSDKLGDLNILVVRDFILYLQNTTRWKNHPFTMPNGSLSPASVQNYVRTLRPFFSWLQREGYTEENILEKLKPPKAPQKLVEILTDEEISRILSCIDANTASGSRHTAMVITFWILG